MIGSDTSATGMGKLSSLDSYDKLFSLMNHSTCRPVNLSGTPAPMVASSVALFHHILTINGTSVHISKTSLRTAPKG